MGNYASCALPTPSLKSGKAARVVTPSGEIRQFRQPTKAAHLMLDFPNFFMVNSPSLRVGRRFSPLPADEDLEFGNVYIMLPMNRVASVVMAADLALLFVVSNSVSKRISGSTTHEAKKSDSDDADLHGGTIFADGFPVETEMMMAKYRISACRSRQPLLETIMEESVCVS